MNCRYCGGLFEIKVHNQLYCSRLCSRRYRAKKEYPDNYQEVVRNRKCLICDTEIAANERKDKVYCSIKCKEQGSKRDKLPTNEAVKIVAEVVKHKISEQEGESVIECEGNIIQIDSKYKDCFNGINLHISNGYARTHYKGVPVPLHKLLYYLEHGKLSDVQHPIDHINRDRLDNRLSNIRLTTVSINNKNRPFNNKTNHKGIYQSGDRFIAQIWRDGKNHHIGRYDTIEEAISARAEVERKVLTS